MRLNTKHVEIGRTKQKNKNRKNQQLGSGITKLIISLEGKIIGVGEVERHDHKEQSGPEDYIVWEIMKN